MNFIRTYLYYLTALLFVFIFSITAFSQDEHQHQPLPEEKKTEEKKDVEKTPTPTPTPPSTKMKMPMDEDDKKSKTEMDSSDKSKDGMSMPKKSSEEIELKPYQFPLPPRGDDFPEPIEDSKNYGKVMFEVFEYEAAANGDNALVWDSSGWYGGDYNRFWFRSEGEIEQSRTTKGDVEFQALYGRLFRPFYDFQVGLRFDHKWDGGERATRVHAVVGIDGIVPYEYEVEPLMFVSTKGDVSFRFTGSKDVLINQRTIVEGRFETNIAVQSVEEFGVGSGLNDMEFGIKLRREIRREFAPYIGISYRRLFGQTADFARLENERADRLSFVAGVRWWF